jgi:hypothetical protein
MTDPRRLHEAAAFLRTRTADPMYAAPLKATLTAVADYLDHVASLARYSARVDTTHAEAIAEAVLATPIAEPLATLNPESPRA